MYPIRVPPARCSSFKCPLVLLQEGGSDTAWGMLARLLDGLLRALRGAQPSPGRETVRSRGGGWTIGNPDALHPYEVKPDHPAADLFDGMRFSATLQARTPLRILRRHGQVLPLGTTLPHDFEPWMGIWIPNTKSWRALGISMEEMPETTVASDAGPVLPSEYLPFLIALREAIEDEAGGIPARIERLKQVCALPKFARFVAALRGFGFLRDRFFPTVLSLIPGLPSRSQTELTRLRLFTVAALRGASDETLLAVNGIGPSKLKAIREFCAGYSGDPKVERVVDLAV